MKNTYWLSSIFVILLFFLIGCEAQASAINLVEGHAKKDSALKKKENIELPKTEMDPLDVPLINQMDHPRLYNGCEVSSLAMLLNYHGYETSKNELAEKIPRVPLTYENGLKGNPNEGFVGDMENGPGLSVYHGPVFEVAKQYAGDEVVDITGEPVDELYNYLSLGLPIWIITTSNFAPVNDFITWDTPSGEIDVTYSVHSVVVTGFDEESVYVNNPYGQKNQKVNKENFEKAWEQMGSQAIVIKHES